jgi:4-hydroxybenzoate polyprenyltransferase
MTWTLFYDTIYAHQDTEDDALIGVKSTARLFGARSPMWLRRFLTATVALMAIAIISALQSAASVLALALALVAPWAMGWHMVWQLRRFDDEDPEKLLAVFRSNRDTGLIPLIFLGLAMLT